MSASRDTVHSLHIILRCAKEAKIKALLGRIPGGQPWILSRQHRTSRSKVQEVFGRREARVKSAVLTFATRGTRIQAVAFDQ